MLYYTTLYPHTQTQTQTRTCLYGDRQASSLRPQGHRTHEAYVCRDSPRCVLTTATKWHGRGSKIHRSRDCGRSRTGGRVLKRRGPSDAGRTWGGPSADEWAAAHLPNPARDSAMADRRGGSRIMLLLVAVTPPAVAFTPAAAPLLRSRAAAAAVAGAAALDRRAQPLRSTFPAPLGTGCSLRVAQVAPENAPCVDPHQAPCTLHPARPARAFSPPEIPCASASWPAPTFCGVAAEVQGRGARSCACAADGGIDGGRVCSRPRRAQGAASQSGG